MRSERRSIAEIRERLDGLDREILDLLNRRIETVRKLGNLKRQAGRAVFDPEREKAVLRRILAANQGPLDDRQLKSIYQAVLRASREAQEAASD